MISKFFCFKMRHVAWSEPQRKHEGASIHSVKYSFSELLIQLNSTLRKLEENRANLFGLFGVRYGTPTTVLQMPFSNHGISFNISLRLMNHGTKSIYFLLENFYSSMKCINFLKKLGENRSIDLKIHIYSL